MGVAAVDASATKLYRFDGFIVDVQSACLRRDGTQPVEICLGLGDFGAGSADGRAKAGHYFG